jgi:hypothetical protein
VVGWEIVVAIHGAVNCCCRRHFGFNSFWTVYNSNYSLVAQYIVNFIIPKTSATFVLQTALRNLFAETSLYIRLAKLCVMKTSHGNILGGL